VAVIDFPQDPGLDLAVAPTWNVIEFARPRLYRLLEGLTPEQLATRPAGFGNSIASLVVHMAAAEVSFAYIIKGEPMPDELAAEFPVRGPSDTPLPEIQGETAISLAAKVEKARAILREALGSLTAGDLDKVLKFPFGAELTARWLLTLIPYHWATHHGQIQMIKQHL